MLSQGSPRAALHAATARPPLVVQVDSVPASASPGPSIMTGDRMQVTGRTLPNALVGVDEDGDGRFDAFTRSGGRGRFRMVMTASAGVDRMDFGLVGHPRMGMVPMTMVHIPRPFDRPFDGSPMPSAMPFSRLVPDPISAQPGLPPRPDARALSQAMAEDPLHPSFSPSIELGLVFFGQFIDHDVNLNLEPGQGPSPDPNNPINMRTPALDLDTVYGRGPQLQPEFYTPDGLFFRLGPGGNDLLRDANGVALIGDPRNDDNAFIAEIHLAFQKYHNLLMTRALNGVDPSTLTDGQRSALFQMVRGEVIATYQGIVANQFAEAITGAPIPDDEPPLASVPVEFDGAVFRLGHTLVPNVVQVDHAGTLRSPTDPSLRLPNVHVPMDLLFGPTAQHAAAFDAKISETMRTLLIPLSPTDPSQGDLIGGDQPNIGGGQIIDGVMHLDLGETNILRGREFGLPSGEEYLARMQGRPYNPLTDGNTDLFVYILEEATPRGHLGPVGTDVVQRTLGGVLAADPYRYTNPALFTPQQIASYRQGTIEGLLHQIGEPGF